MAFKDTTSLNCEFSEIRVHRTETAPCACAFCFMAFNMQTTPPVILLLSGDPITAATVSVLKEYITAQGTQPEARALRPQLITLAQQCRAAQLIAENRYLVTNDLISNMRVPSSRRPFPTLVVCHTSVPSNLHWFLNLLP